MANQENKQNGGSSNQRKRSHKFFRKKNNNKPNGSSNSHGSSNKVTAKKEYKFHMHDSQARKTSESFDKIKKAIILKIQETFEESLNIVESLEKKQRRF